MKCLQAQPRSIQLDSGDKIKCRYKSNSSQEPNIDNQWKAPYDTIRATTTKALGLRKCICQDQFDENDEEIAELIEEKHRLHKVVNKTLANKTTFNKICLKLHSQLQEMANSWLRRKGEKIQEFAEH